jgi:hypothetical protein
MKTESLGTVKSLFKVALVQFWESGSIKIEFGMIFCFYLNFLRYAELWRIVLRPNYDLTFLDIFIFRALGVASPGGRPYHAVVRG